MVLYTKGTSLWDYLKKAWKRYAIAASLLLAMLAVFMTIEALITADFHLINIPFDEKIPFIPAFVVPYVLWFPYLIGSYIYLAATQNLEYRRMASSLFIGWGLFMVFCLLYPNGLDLRPALPETGGGAFIFVLRIIYGADTPTNVCPSMHVYATLCMHFAMLRTAPVQKRPWLRAALYVFVALVAASTVFIKQHSIVDVIAGFGYYAVMHLIIYRLLPEKRFGNP